MHAVEKVHQELLSILLFIAPEIDVSFSEYALKGDWVYISSVL